MYLQSRYEIETAEVVIGDAIGDVQVLNRAA